MRILLFLVNGTVFFFSVLWPRPGAVLILDRRAAVV